MQNLYFALSLFLLLNLSAGLWRIFRGPSKADRMLATQLFGTTAVAILLLLAQATEKTVILDVALLFALLAAVTAVAFVRRAWSTTNESTAQGSAESSPELPNNPAPQQDKP